MDSVPAFAYPDDMVTARDWLESGRVRPGELEACHRLQRADPLPPRSLEDIGKDLGILRRLPVARAVERFEEEAKHRLTRHKRFSEESHRGMEPPDYLLVRRMGEGGQGEVFLAQQHSPKRVVVLKRLRGELATDGRNVLRFLQEALLMERVDDPQVVHVYDYGVDGPRYYITMEYVAGESLSDYLGRTRFLPLDETLEILHAAALCLESVSAGGVVHADVKPANFVIPVRGPRIKLIDFGAATEAGRPQSEDGGWFGSPPFMAPEQFRGQALSSATDIYGLGITAYLMLTGRLPFMARTAKEIALMQMKEPLPSLMAMLPGIPSRVASLVRRMTEKEPLARWESFEAIAEETSRILDSLRGEAPPVQKTGTGSVRSEPPRRPAQTRFDHGASTKKISGSSLSFPWRGDTGESG